MTTKTSLHNITFLAGGGEMGELTRSKDWSQTSLGAPETWPQSLRTALSLILHSKFPMFIWWGPELICFYNDAYRPSLGNNGKHPSILGEPAETAWAEIWDVIRPLIDQVLAGGEATWSEDQLIPIFRNGKLEDVYWTFSYSAVNDESGQPAGVLVTCCETTEKVITLKNLQNNNKKYVRDIMQAPVAMCLFRGKNHVVEIANEQMLELWGKQAQEVMNKPIFEGLPEAKGQGLEEIVDKVFATGEKFTANERPVDLPRNGNVETIYVNFSYVALRDYDGSISGLIATANDVTAQVVARQKVEESEKRFRSVANSAPVLIWMSGTDKLCNFFNKAWLNFTGRSMEQENGNGWAEGVHPDDFDRCLEMYVNSFDKRDEFYMEYRLKRADGKYRWISDNGTPRFTPDGIFEGYIGACMDIHESVISHQKLKENEERLNIVIDSSELGTWELNLATNEVTHSEKYLDIFDYKNDQPVTRELLMKRLHPADEPIRAKAMKEAMVTGKLQFILRLIWEDKSIHWIESKGKVFYNENNQPQRIIGTVRDITDAKNYQQGLTESEQKFRLLADSMPQHVWTSDIQGHLNYFNRGVYTYSGLTHEQMMQGGWLELVHPDDREKNIHLWTKALTTGQDFTMEHRLRRHDGQYRWQLSYAVPQRDPEGAIQMWVGTSSDIQDQKIFTTELEHEVKERTRQLELKNKDLERMNAELQSFAYVASHDLQEPLRKIQTFANRILQKESAGLSDTGKDSFRRMHEAAKRMQTLIEDLLAYSRTNETQSVFKKTDLDEIIKDVKNDFKEAIIEKNAIIEVKEMCHANVVPFQFRQLMHNLLGNSLKFSIPGKQLRVTFTCEVAKGEKFNVEALTPDKTYCYLSVSDNGIGFEPQYSKRIFEVFQRLHGKDEYSGTGIGLAIVKKIVDNHQGIIIANGEVNNGARFDIYFPTE